ncbi:MAG: hypothetical protein CFH44_00448 [Proteobacteria bacterium]|nr:MAG: hypothetical protein CFH44_00448 [Pseudomonadota bacterium]
MLSKLKTLVIVLLLSIILTQPCFAEDSNFVITSTNYFLLGVSVILFPVFLVVGIIGGLLGLAVVGVLFIPLAVYYESKAVIIKAHNKTVNQLTHVELCPAALEFDLNLKNTHAYTKVINDTNAEYQVKNLKTIIDEDKLTTKDIKKLFILPDNSIITPKNANYNWKPVTGFVYQDTDYIYFARKVGDKYDTMVSDFDLVLPYLTYRNREVFKLDLNYKDRSINLLNFCTNLKRISVHKKAEMEV